MQTGKHAANVGSRLKLAWKPGRRHLKSQPSSRIGENSPYGMIGGIEETSASFEAPSAPRSYPTGLLRELRSGATGRDVHGDSYGLRQFNPLDENLPARI